MLSPIHNCKFTTRKANRRHKFYMIKLTFSLWPCKISMSPNWYEHANPNKDYQTSEEMLIWRVFFFSPGRKFLTHLPLMSPERTWFNTFHAVTHSNAAALSFETPRMHNICQYNYQVNVTWTDHVKNDTGTWQSPLWALQLLKSQHAPCVWASASPSLPPGLWRTAQPAPAHASLYWH